MWGTVHAGAAVPADMIPIANCQFDNELTNMAPTSVSGDVSVSEIKTYKANGTDAHYAVFCMNNLYTKTAMFYEETEAR